MPDPYVGEQRADDEGLIEWRGDGWYRVEEKPSVMSDRSLTDRAVDALPMVGGTVGGILGGLSGLPTLGLGSVPGAIAGASALGAGGEAARQLINRARGKEAPTEPLEAAKDIAVQGGIQGAFEGAGAGVSRVLAKGGRAVLRGYLKPALSERLLPKANEIVDTVVREGLPVTEKGAQRAGALVQELQGEVERILRQTQGGQVDLTTVADRVRDFAKRRYFKPGIPSADFDAAMKVADSIDQHASVQAPGAPPRASVPVGLSEANQIKRGLDSSIGETNFGVERGATKTTQKVSRRILRKEMESQAPEIAPLNAREAKLIDAAKALARAVGRESNKNPLMNVPTLISGIAGLTDYSRGGDAAGAAARAMALRMALSPTAATNAAIVAARLGELSGAYPATAARVAIHAVLETQRETGDDEQVPEGQ